MFVPLFILSIAHTPPMAPTPDEAWLIRGRRAVVALEEKDIDGCTRALETAFSRHMTQTEGARPIRTLEKITATGAVAVFALTINDGPDSIQLEYAYDKSGALQSSALTHLPDGTRALLIDDGIPVLASGGCRYLLGGSAPFVSRVLEPADFETVLWRARHPAMSITDGFNLDALCERRAQEKKKPRK